MKKMMPKGKHMMEEKEMGKEEKPKMRNMKTKSGMPRMQK